MSNAFVIAKFSNSKGKTEIYYGATDPIVSKLDSVFATYEFFPDEKAIINRLSEISSHWGNRGFIYTNINNNKEKNMYWILSIFKKNTREYYYGERSHVIDKATSVKGKNRLIGKAYNTKELMLWQLEYHKKNSPKSKYIAV
ncbi:hypothetical protein PC41400_14575 [Paenibacillus chitinolyticus]|uniref:Uncharacterized protein n=1 Tax=Paenibacillus chitinolyticus TaxID=79263 RepID=A0A410WX32_9BACL|nr:hypothetical protein [Paenibacillus chitinolyticus]MCY9594125.1 hypothetical protein [Paenibacillus chitinolyticus]MCY9599661.1 hypothetical protein [Paenibacillus chitinolyticus]QAV18837.1 hypothetical protein PC41400_14575 [Paenibacillus chitinolyticus]